MTSVKHKVLSEEKAFTKMQREIELFQKLEKKSLSDREPIPDDVRMFVWRRDNGHCVRCGSDHNLEYDHIIPVSPSTPPAREFTVMPASTRALRARLRLPAITVMR